jgi:SAM-dependent methyltransferase
MLSIIPIGGELNYLFQKYFTHTLPLSTTGFLSRTETTKLFFDKYIEYSQKNPNDVICYEFSSGTHLQNPIGLSVLGIKRIHTLDVKRIAKPKLVTSTIQNYRDLKPKINYDYCLPDAIPDIKTKTMKKVLSEHFNILYEAPADVRKTCLEEKSIDLVVSRTSLEHIPEKDIRPVVLECYRVLKKEAIAIFSIDFRDHWSFFDPKTSIYNFLKYDPSQWKFFNPSIHYQNRMRHVDFERVFKKTNFHMLESIPMLPTPEEEKELGKIKLAPCFRDYYSTEQLAIKRSIFILRK